MSGITAHMIVKNEDQWVWFAIQSILPYVDQILITDTGSTDHTVELITSIGSPKIKFSKAIASSPAEVTAVRTLQLKETKTPWVWIIDADEIYPSATAKEIVTAVKSNAYEGIVVGRYDLLGDIYHRQIESVGQYNLFGKSGHLLIRLVNIAKIKGLTYRGDYPNEGFFDGEGNSILTHNPRDWYVTKNHLYHAMYLRRSSLGSTLPMLNRGKFKIEQGIRVQGEYPEVFAGPRPPYVSDPCRSRSLPYEIAAAIITPIKKLKRRYL